MFSMRAGKGGAITRNFIRDPPASGHIKRITTPNPKVREGTSSGNFLCAISQWLYASKELPEDILHLTQKRAVFWLILDLGEPFELLQELTLPLRGLAGRLHPNFYKQIALPVAVQHRHAPAAN